MLLAQLAQALDQLAHERVREDGGEPLRDEDADRAAAPHREGSRGGVGGVAQVVRDAQDALERGLAKALGVVEGKGHGRLRDAGPHGHVSDGDPGHPTRLLA